MAGHSQFKNIMYRKGAQDIKKAKIFAKIAREIIVAVRSGSEDASSNPRLRAALAMARASNMPKDNIERAIKKAKSNLESDNLEEIRYEGYGHGGVAVIVEAMTDNRNRTASDVRSIFTKYGGSLGETGSVGFLFEHIGVFYYDASIIKFESLFESAIEAGAEDVSEGRGEEDPHVVTCSINMFASVRDSLFKKVGDAIEGKMIWKPISPVNSKEESVRKMIDMLEDHDDVQNVYTNLN